MNPRFLSLILLLGALALSPQAQAQGTLTPPPTGGQAVGLAGPLGSSGQPMPTMKTFHQIEPRHDLLNGPWGVGDIIVDISDSRAHYVIKKSGSYYLSANLEVTKNYGIIIEADNVTLDLNGFSIFRGGYTRTAIYIDISNGTTPPPQHLAGVVTIRNGSFQHLGMAVGSDLMESYANLSCVYDDLSFIDCGACIFLRGYGVVSNCTAHGCNSDSASATVHSTLFSISAGVIRDCQITRSCDNGSAVFLGSGRIERLRLQGGDDSASNGVSAANVAVEDCVISWTGYAALDLTPLTHSASVKDCVFNVGEDTRGIVAYSATVENNVIAGDVSSPGLIGINVPSTHSGTVIQGNRVSGFVTGLSLSSATNTVVQNHLFENTTNFDVVAGNRIGQVVRPTTTSAFTGDGLGAASGTFSGADPWANFVD